MVHRAGLKRGANRREQVVASAVVLLCLAVVPQATGVGLDVRGGVAQALQLTPADTVKTIQDTLAAKEADKAVTEAAGAADSAIAHVGNVIEKVKDKEASIATGASARLQKMMAAEAVAKITLLRMRMRHKCCLEIVKGGRDLVYNKLREKFAELKPQQVCPFLKKYQFPSLDVWGHKLPFAHAYIPPVSREGKFTLDFSASKMALLKCMCTDTAARWVTKCTGDIVNENHAEVKLLSDTAREAEDNFNKMIATSKELGIPDSTAGKAAQEPDENQLAKQAGELSSSVNGTSSLITAVV